VTDLTAADFTVLESRQPQRVAHFWTQTLTPAPEAAATPLERLWESRTVGPRNRRVFLIVLGRGRLQPPAKGVDGVIHLVRDRLLPQDHVAVLAWNRATDFTTDHQAVASMLERFKKSHESIESKLRQQFSGLAAVYGSAEINPATQQMIDAVFDGPGTASRTLADPEIPDRARIQQDVRRATDALQTRSTVDAVDPAEALGVAGLSFDRYVAASAQSMQDLGQIYAGINYLRHLDGEKRLIFLSERGIVLPRGSDDRSVAATASDARVAVDIIHTGGLPDGVGPDWTAVTARVVAEQTGGSFTGTSMAAAAIDALDASSRFQYVLGYYTPSPLLDGRFRRIVVRVNRPDVTVRYRRGYFARADPPPLERRQTVTQTRMAAAAAFTGTVPDLKVRGTATMSPRNQTPVEVTVEVTIDATRLALQLTDGVYVGSVDIAVYCGDARERLVGQAWQRINFKLSEGSRGELIKTGVPYTVRVPVRVAASTAKVVVYDYGADLLGSAILRVR
jgi:VWFA-related protein